MHQVTMAQQSSQLAQATIENARLQDTLQAAQQEFIQVRSEREQLASYAKELLAARRTLQAKQDALQQELAEARTALAVHAREAVLLTEHLARMGSQSEALTQEKLALLQQQASLQAELRQCREQMPKQ
jgi:uncharacterized coiled-coil DUF342 family protein